MPRIARIVGIGLPHHITQRGNYGQGVFLNDYDRKKYLSWIQEYSDKYGVSLLAYCLMANHVHFIGIPAKSDSLAKTFNVAHMRYSQYFNKKINASGHLWQGRFYSCVLDKQHMVVAVKYIETNPVRANIVRNPWEWKWSSASVHVGEREEGLQLRDLFSIIDMPQDRWRHYIKAKEDEEKMDAIRKNTLTGRPLGEVQFIESLEKKFEKRLVSLPRGRPKKRTE